MRLLIVEDEVGLAEGMKAILEKEGYAVDVVFDGLTGLDFALSSIYDLILLDIMLPKLNGLDILKNLRAQKIETPILLLTAKSEVEDKISGLDFGADDYLTKPFDPRELLARVRALSRRKQSYIDHDLEYGDLRLNRNTKELICLNQSMKLGLKEYQITECLIINKHQIISKEILFEKVWGFDDESEYNNVEVYISFIRKKLVHLKSSVQIRVTRGIGYSLEGDNND